MDVNTLYVKKLTMNKAEIIFDKIEKAIAWDEFLKAQRVENTKIVYHKEGNTYFGFKMFRCCYQMPAIMLQLNKIETMLKLKEIYKPKLKAGVTFFDEFVLETKEE